MSHEGWRGRLGAGRLLLRQGVRNGGARDRSEHAALLAKYDVGGCEGVARLGQFGRGRSERVGMPCEQALLPRERAVLRHEQAVLPDEPEVLPHEEAVLPCPPATLPRARVALPDSRGKMPDDLRGVPDELARELSETSSLASSSGCSTCSDSVPASAGRCPTHSDR